MAQNKKIFVIAGPNGAGKTTTALAFKRKQLVINIPHIWEMIEESSNA